ncbi:hypothetical protein NNJEOMEG_01980 [Fundidesulfovibrio magnetotacticus]|uniref:Lipoprotein n=1 Tax=Fundidesulfovibrio magnetotacticus TaxID=2730080 RepID=A0A6V8LU78_9BACT|nr:hypothetical protein [Fundidesulfovibrio magnetotacticus]GFK94141.1 hypothetical protein NNJEOMEG_01980 [Fundidesulfovibrio magnetotacticus]
MRHVLTALLLFSLAGCAGADRPLTLSEFYGFCWPMQQGSGCWDDNLCEDYRGFLQQEQTSKAECIKGCNEIETMEWRQNALRGCDGSIRNATDWCEKYCRRLFDYGNPAQAE